jgi:predicted nucleotide-binding protein
LATKTHRRPKPRVFVGSSSSARQIAEAFVSELSRTRLAQVVPWWRSPEFVPMTSILSGLLKAVDKGVSAYDFGLFILAADDVLISKGKQSSTPRDNVIFELGLFLGAYGQDRTFAVIQEADKPSLKVKAPSDFGGIIIPSFEVNNKKVLKSAVREAAAQIRERIKEKWRIQLSEKVSDKELFSIHFDWVDRKFRINIKEEFLRRNAHLFKGGKLLLIAYEYDPSLNFDEMKKIAVSAPRNFPRFSQDIILRAPDKQGKKNIFSNIRPGTEVEGRVFLIPDSLSVRPGMTIKDYLNAGAEFAFGGAEEAKSGD